MTTKRFGVEVFGFREQGFERHFKTTQGCCRA